MLHVTFDIVGVHVVRVLDLDRLVDDISFMVRCLHLYGVNAAAHACAAAGGVRSDLSQRIELRNESSHFGAADVGI